MCAGWSGAPSAPSPGTFPSHALSPPAALRVLSLPLTSARPPRPIFRTVSSQPLSLGQCPVSTHWAGSSGSEYCGFLGPTPGPQGQKAPVRFWGSHPANIDCLALNSCLGHLLGIRRGPWSSTGLGHLSRGLEFFCRRWTISNRDSLCLVPRAPCLLASRI